MHGCMIISTICMLLCVACSMLLYDVIWRCVDVIFLKDMQVLRHLIMFTIILVMVLGMLMCNMYMRLLMSLGIFTLSNALRMSRAMVSISTGS